MAKMDYNKKERVRLKADFLRLVLGAEPNPARRNLLTDFVETYMPLNEEQQNRFDRLVETKKQYREVMRMVTAYEQTGIKKGHREGAYRRQAGRPDSVLRGTLRPPVRVEEDGSAQNSGRRQAQHACPLRGNRRIHRRTEYLIARFPAGATRGRNLRGESTTTHLFVLVVRTHHDR
jgi:hypothetical protein